jgi:hypothetical protein
MSGFDRFQAVGAAPAQGGAAPQPQAQGAPQAATGFERFTPLAELRNQPPANSGWAGERRALGLGVRDVAQGFGALPGMLYNAAALPVRGVIGLANMAGADLPQVRSAEQNIDTVADTVGLPRPETQSERVASGIVRGGAAALIPAGIAARFAQAPGAVGNVATMLATNPGTQVVAGATGGGAQSAAEEAGAGPVGQFAAGVAGGAVGALGMEGVKGAGRMALAAMEPFSAQGPDRIAGRALYQSSASPETVQARIADGVSDQSRRVPGAPVTTAQAAQDPGLAIIESGLRNDPTGGVTSPAMMLRDVEFRRNAARQNAMQGMQPLPGVDAATRGNTIRATLADAERNNLPGGASDFVRKFLGTTTGAADDFYGNLDALGQQRAAASRPLYERAMSNNAWSPRVDDFINDPVAKQGLARGFQIQRLEATARGEPFDPRQMGVTFNAAGDPVLVGRPNMRVLDMVKAGLDDILEGYRNGTTGRLNLDRTGKAIDEFRRSYVNTLDDLNPDYKAARQAWAGPSQSRDALAAGREALRGDPEQVARRLQSMPEGDKDFFRAGMLRDLQDQFARGDAQAFALFRNANSRQALEAAFGKENIDGLAEHLNQHASRFGRDGSGASAVGRILATDAAGNPTLPIGNVGGNAVQNLQSARQTLSAIPAGPQREQVRKSLQSEFIDRFQNAAQTSSDVVGVSGDRSRALSAAGARKFFEQNSDLAREIFSPQELRQLQRLMSDFGETAGLQATAAARGSPTAQNLMVGNMISRATGGLVDPASPTAQTVFGLGPTMRLLYSAPEAATREALARALVDPQEAMRLMQLAGPQAASRASGYANSQMRDRLAQALMGELARGGARTANALAIQGQTGP